MTYFISFIEGNAMDRNSKKIELKLKNIGYIKEANIDISGLTVIAGKNDEGKSTVGKALMAIIKANNKALSKTNIRKSLEQRGKIYFNEMIDYIFDLEVSSNGKVAISVNGAEKYVVCIKYNKCVSFNTVLPKNVKDKEFVDCTFIQTPLIWDLEEIFNAIDVLRGDDSLLFDIRYPYILRDLYSKLTLQQRQVRSNRFITNTISNKIETVIRNLIGGEFVKKHHNKVHRFYPTNKNNYSDISLKDIAIGIKVFGIIQVLMRQKCFTPQGYFVFDEPENHLHPTWQLALAEILVILAKNGIRIMINTHSPYMLEALDKYSKKHNAYTKFYLADKGIVQQINGSNAGTLEEIFKKLNEPFKIFDEMENK